jgi:glutathione S-transferase
MAFEYVSVDEAIGRKGLRMVVVGGIPSPWGEAAKGVFHIKGIDWAGVRLDYESEALKEWAGGRNGPIAVYDNEKPRSGWAEILLLAERLAPLPALLPHDLEPRALVLGLAHELLGEGSLSWQRRLQLIHVGLSEAGGFPIRVSKYLAKKYGYSPALGEAATARVAALLRMFAARLHARAKAGSPYLVGDAVSAADVYLASVMAMFGALPPEQCKMDEGMRAAFETRDEATAAALDPVLFAHRDMMYSKHLALPLQL